MKARDASQVTIHDINSSSKKTLTDAELFSNIFVSRICLSFGRHG